MGTVSAPVEALLVLPLKLGEIHHLRGGQRRNDPRQSLVGGGGGGGTESAGVDEEGDGEEGED